MIKSFETAASISGKTRQNSQLFLAFFEAFGLNLKLHMYVGICAILSGSLWLLLKYPQSPTITHNHPQCLKTILDHFLMEGVTGAWPSIRGVALKHNIYIHLCTKNVKYCLGLNNQASFDRGVAWAWPYTEAWLFHVKYTSKFEPQSSRA